MNKVFQAAPQCTVSLRQPKPQCRSSNNRLRPASQDHCPASSIQAAVNRSSDATIEQARRSLESAQADLDSAEQDLIVRLSQAYFDVLAAKETLASLRAMTPEQAEVAALKDYTTICSAAPSELLSLIALRARERVLARSLENDPQRWTNIANGIKAIGSQAREALRLEAGIPKAGTELNEEIVPPEANLEGKAFSLNKGCYPGQEVVARMDTYGNVRRKLVGLVLKDVTVPPKGAKLFSGDREIGWVSSAAMSPQQNGIIAFGFPLRDFSTAGTTLSIDVDGKKHDATVADLPFYRRA